MFFSITVVSTAIRFRLLSVTAPEARAALLVLVSSHSTPSSPIRLRQRVSEDGSIGGRCWTGHPHTRELLATTPRLVTQAVHG